MPSRGSERRSVNGRAPGSLLGRPGFIVASFGVALLVVAGVVVSILGAVGARPSEGDEVTLAERQGPAFVPSPTMAASPEPVGQAAAGAASPSSCGLPEVEVDTTQQAADWRLAIAPETSWRDVDVNLAPSGATAGPGMVHDGGFAYCFQRSPEGALFAAANFLVQSNTLGLRAPLLDYVLAPGDYRDALLAESNSAAEVVRLQIVGYRMLAFDGQTARVDVAQRVTVDGTTRFIAAVVELDWEDGDWRIPTHAPDPVRMQALSDVSGYVRWGA